MNRRMYKGPFWPTLEEALRMEMDAIGVEPLSVVRIVVPSRLLKRYLRHALAEGKPGLAGVEFLDFNSISTEGSICSLAKRGLRLAPPLGKTLIARKALATLKSGDRFYRLKDKSGFAAALLATISDLKEARITPEDLENHARQNSASGNILELARLFGEYQRILKSNRLCDDKDRVSLAVEHFRDHPPIHETPVIIHGVYDATNLQMELLRAYIGDSDAIALVPWWEDTRAFLEPYVDFLRRLDFKESKAPEVTEREVVPVLLSAPGESREAREVVREIVHHCIKNNIPLDEAAILLRQPEQYAPLFRDELEAANVPYYMHSCDALSATPAGRALSYLLDLTDGVFTRKAVIRFLEGSPLKPRGDSVSPPAVERWGRFAREAGIVEGRDEWFNRLKSLKAGRRRPARRDDLDDDQAAARLEDVAEIDRMFEFLTELFDSISALSDEASWGEYSLLLEDIYSRFIDVASDGAKDVLDIIRSTARLEIIGMKTNAVEVVTLLNNALTETRITPKNSKEHGLVVAALMDARCVPFRAVAVPGVVERSFPRVVRQDPLLLDDERKEINRRRRKSGLPEIDLKGRGRFEEEMLFRIARGAARESLTVSYPRVDPQSGREKMPSTFFLRLAEQKAGTHITVEDLKKEDIRRGSLSRPFPLDPESALLNIDYHLSSTSKLIGVKDEKNVSALMYLGNAAVSSFFGRALDAEITKSGRRDFTPYEGAFSSPEAMAALKSGGFTIDDRPVSPGKFEAYAKCPYKYFIENVLGVEIPEEPERISQLGALEKGALIHDILYRFFSDRRDSGRLPIRVADLDEHIEVMSKISVDIFSDFEKSGGAGWPMLWEMDKAAILGSLTAFLEDEAKDDIWLPRYFETRFGYRHPAENEDKEITQDAPVEVDLPSGVKVLLRGRIDRIDLEQGGTGARVIDYKSGGHTGYKNESLQGGETMQLPLYALAAAAMLPDRRPISAEYRFIKSGARRKYSDALSDASLAELSFVISTLREGVRHGLFFAHDGAQCRYCDLARHCRGLKNYEAKKEATDPRLENWRKMKGMDGDDDAE